MHAHVFLRKSLGVYIDGAHCSPLIHMGTPERSPALVSRTVGRFPSSIRWNKTRGKGHYLQRQARVLDGTTVASEVRPYTQEIVAVMPLELL